MTTVVEKLEQLWRSRLLQDAPQLQEQQRENIVVWLLGEKRSLLEQISPKELEIYQQGMDYRYRILHQRYLKASPTQAYSNLINRLGSLVMLRNKIKTWVALSRDRRREVADVIQEVIQEMLNTDKNIQQQITWISQCTNDHRLRNSLLLTSVEEYCLRPIRNQPLLVYRFVNFLRRQGKGGMTQVPRQEMIRLVSEEISPEEGESSLSLLDHKAIAEYQTGQDWEEKQRLRISVQQEFRAYLAENLGDEAVKWFNLYLRGNSQEAIAQNLNIPTKQVYRLREKISYHAIRVFTLKGKPELVANWLEVSLQEHNLGLTPTQWEQYWQTLTPTQRQIIEHLKAGDTPEEICQQLNLKKNQLMSEWGKLYLTAQNIRNKQFNY